ncbi:MAG: redoxin domain-containing protein [Nitrospinae bacterium]|nr:redoxin domain-containing protein [Nitrospinota bacterium]
MPLERAELKLKEHTSLKDLEEKVDTSIERGATISESFQINKIIILVAVALVLRGILNYTPPITPLKVGDKAPNFSLKLVDGTTFNFSPHHAHHHEGSGADGKPMVMFFYANWCPCSNASAQFLKQASEEFSGVSLIGIGIQDNEIDLSKFLEKHKLKFPAGFDLKQEIARSYGVTTTPTTIFINKEGKIDSIFVGKLKKYEEISERIQKLIAHG